jgi:hypothetical protein
MDGFQGVVEREPMRAFAQERKTAWTGQLETWSAALTMFGPRRFNHCVNKVTLGAGAAKVKVDKRKPRAESVFISSSAISGYPDDAASIRALTNIGHRTAHTREDPPK